MQYCYVFFNTVSMQRYIRKEFFRQSIFLYRQSYTIRLTQKVPVIPD